MRPSNFRAYDRSLRWNQSFPISKEEMWNRWTTLDGLGTFFGAKQRVDFHVGGRFEILFLLDQAEGLQGSEGCTILCLEPGKRLVFSWNAPPHLPDCRGQHTVVSVRLDENEQGECLLELEHSGFGVGDQWDATFAYFEEGWPRVLERLQASFKG